ncbi:hypothetical protein F3Y22_tig00111086pilonHSYRG00007 [Hibiscus syriacus]|uniref:RNase H type-1 domain-containing protein n=1 Tax=Hibiscus syriacus TaxID=106335 RepID=A0A6A2Z4Q6_HIBSY|nr:hypothetical protein F3Y22_tig00111086pilonHSYRG00007 [Hibiscus syriacus]
MEIWLAENLNAAKCLDEFITGFAAIIWKLWTSRCRRIFEPNGNLHDDLGLWQSIVTAAKDVLLVYRKMPNASNRQFLVAWKAPTDGAIKLNIDGASQGNLGIPGAGGIFRNAAGEWVLGFSALLGVCSSIAAELQAFRLGLAIAWEHG